MSLSFHGTEIWDSFEARMILLRQFRSQFTCAELMFYIEIWGSVAYAVCGPDLSKDRATDTLNPKPSSLKFKTLSLKPESPKLVSTNNRSTQSSF